MKAIPIDMLHDNFDEPSPLEVRPNSTRKGVRTERLEVVLKRKKR